VSGLQFIVKTLFGLRRRPVLFGVEGDGEDAGPGMNAHARGELGQVEFGAVKPCSDALSFSPSSSSSA
jgi:hypothetical protein